MTLRLPTFERARVLVAGDVMLDRYWHGDTGRISPEAPVPVVRIGSGEERPGGAGNVALNAAALGTATSVLGVVGRDEAAATLEARLREAGVHCHFEPLEGFATPTKLRVVSRHQQLIRLDFEAANAPEAGRTVLERFQALLQDVDAVALSDYGKGTLRPAQGFIEAARAAGRPVVVDPKGCDFSVYHGASVVTPNLLEFEAVVGRAADADDMAQRAQALMEAHALEAVLVTRGEHGMSLYRDRAQPVHLPAHAREVFDVTGAGDTVVAVLAAALAAGADLPTATAAANLAAGIVVGKLGTATVTVPELQRALHDQQEAGHRVLPEDELIEAVRVARAHGERIVMTNGCFDLLHAGHVAYLEQARRLGDRLVVAVNDDEGVRALKGAGRPLNPLGQRMAVLAGLAAVDWVVPFSEATPARLVEQVQPDCLVKGGDYRPEHVAGYDAVTAYGGEVIVLDYVEGCSTSGLIEAIRNDGRSET